MTTVVPVGAVFEEQKKVEMMNIEEGQVKTFPIEVKPIPSVINQHDTVPLRCWAILAISSF